MGRTRERLGGRVRIVRDKEEQARVREAVRRLLRRRRHRTRRTSSEAPGAVQEALARRLVEGREHDPHHDLLGRQTVLHVSVSGRRHQDERWGPPEGAAVRSVAEGRDDGGGHSRPLRRRGPPPNHRPSLRVLPCDAGGGVGLVETKEYHRHRP